MADKDFEVEVKTPAESGYGALGKFHLSVTHSGGKMWQTLRLNPDEIDAVIEALSAAKWRMGQADKA